MNLTSRVGSWFSVDLDDLCKTSSRDYISTLLPCEIIFLIFKHALAGPLLREGRLHFQAIRSVCSEWRQICFSNPILWSSLVVQHTGGHLFPLIENAFDRWLSRVEIRLVDTSESGMSAKDSTALSELVLRYQSRWRSLFICGIGRCFWDIFHKAPRGGWVNLRELAVWTFRLLDNAGGNGIEVLNHILPLQSTPLQVVDLTIAAVMLIDATHILNLISRYTHPRTIALDIPQAHILPSSSLISIMLHYLELLTLTGPNFTIQCHLNTPALSDFRVHFFPEHQRVPDPNLHTFLTRCRKVRSVDLCGHGEHAAWMLPTVCAQPTITRLTIQPWPDVGYENEDQNNASWWDTRCPNLQELNVVVKWTKSIREDEKEMKLLMSLVSFLRRRNQLGRRRLDRLVFKNSYDATDFPHEMFGGLGIGKLCVMVSW
ncbi:hypothetical protein BKA70DRAFT_1444199 [Coprinopsis sp. MPI-PUGE-AT-0042]|nr:hypothetical protein BKA70DRAFT_1444199 [Coprinopsis sp. MPI-PUGE-AT-0042]